MSEKASISAAARLAGVSRQRLYQLDLGFGPDVCPWNGRRVRRVSTSPSLPRCLIWPTNRPNLTWIVSCLRPACLPILAPRRFRFSCPSPALLADRDQQLRDAREREAWMRAHVDLIQREAEARLAEANSRQRAIIAQGKAVIARYRSALEMAN